MYIYHTNWRTVVMDLKRYFYIKKVYIELVILSEINKQAFYR